LGIMETCMIHCLYGEEDVVYGRIVDGVAVPVIEGFLWIEKMKRKTFRESG